MRHLFGLSPADLAMEKDGDTMLLRPASVGQVYDAYTSGSTITDLLDIDGATPITQVTADDNAIVGLYGPDGVKLLYIDFGFGMRFAMTATTIGTELDLTTAAVALKRDIDYTMPGIVLPGDVLRQLNTVTTSDTNMLERYYKTFLAYWLNEKGLPRARRVDSETVRKTFGRGNDPTANGVNNLEEWYDDNGAGGDRTVGRVGAHGGAYFANTDYTAWGDVPIAGGTTVGKYSAAVDGTNNRNRLQVMAFEGGRMARGRGIVLNANVAGATDELITQPGSIPDSLTYLGMGGTVSARPQREREIVFFTTGAGGQRGVVYPNGSIGILGSAPAGSSTSFLSFDSAEWSLEL